MTISLHTPGIRTLGDVAAKTVGPLVSRGLARAGRALSALIVATVRHRYGHRDSRIRRYLTSRARRPEAASPHKERES